MDSVIAGGLAAQRFSQPQYKLLGRNVEVEVMLLLLDEGISVTRGLHSVVVG